MGRSKGTSLALAAAIAGMAFTAAPALAAGSWVALNSGTTNKLDAVSFVDTSHGWAVGVAGTILATSDGGVTWSGQTSGTTNELGGVSFVDSANGWAVGANATILHTSNGGSTWSAQAFPNPPHSGALHAVHFVDSLHGWAVGETGCTSGGFAVGCPILATANGGTTWTIQSSDSSLQLYGVSFPPGDASHGWAVGALGKVLATSNGGGTWVSQTSGFSSSLNAVSFVDATHGWLVQDVLHIGVTSNGGANWTTQTACMCLNQGLNGVAFVDTSNGWAVGSGGIIVATTDGGATWTNPASGTSQNLNGVSAVDVNHVWAVGGSGAMTAFIPPTQGASSYNQYSLSNSDGITWQQISSLQIAASPSANQYTLLSGNADLWTSTAGYNQDLGIFVSDNGGTDTLLAWKESGGFAGTFSPNAAYVQHLYGMTGGHSYVFKLKLKTNKNAPNSTIYAGAGAGPAPYSPTTLTAETFPVGVTPNFAVSTAQYTLSNSDGATWQTMDATNLTTTLSPAASGSAVLGANADLWTSLAGYNQDLGIFVSDNGGADTLVAWKESGGFAGTYSPNAAFVKATYPLTGTHSYAFKLKWKTNKNAPGATIWSAAGGPGNFSPTSLFAQYIAAGANPYGSVSTSQYTLANSDGATWQPMDPALNVSVNPATNTNSIVGANADLFTANAGYNQDIGVFVSVNGGPDTLFTWKESGGFAGTYSPNAAFAQAVYPMAGGRTYVFKLKWKTNINAPGSLIYAGAGPSGGLFSPTRLTVELTN